MLIAQSHFDDSHVNVTAPYMSGCPAHAYTRSGSPSNVLQYVVNRKVINEGGVPHVASLPPIGCMCGGITA